MSSVFQTFFDRSVSSVRAFRVKRRLTRIALWSGVECWVSSVKRHGSVPRIRVFLVIVIGCQAALDTDAWHGPHCDRSLRCSDVIQLRGYPENMYTLQTHFSGPPLPPCNTYVTKRVQTPPCDVYKLRNFKKLIKISIKMYRQCFFTYLIFY